MKNIGCVQHGFAITRLAKSADLIAPTSALPRKLLFSLLRFMFYYMYLPTE